MLAKKYRLPVQSVLHQKGQTVRERYFFAKKFPAAKTFSRMGVVVSAKVAPKASMRNKIKRAVYTYGRGVLKTLPLGDYLVVAEKGAYELTANNAIISELQKIFKH